MIGVVGGSGFIGLELARHLSKSFVIKILYIKPVSKDVEGEVEYIIDAMYENMVR